jgi:FXSXX-COOH protein
MAPRTAPPQPVTDAEVASTLVDLTDVEIDRIRPADGSPLAHAVSRVLDEARTPVPVSAGFNSTPK